MTTSTPATASGSADPTRPSRFRLSFRLPGVLAEPRVLIGLSVLILLLLIALCAPWLAPHAPNDQDLLSTLLPPMWSAGGNPDYPLGTDALGQCILSRMIYGARVAMIIATVAPLGAALLGCVLALLAGYRGGWIDWLIMRVVDIWMSFPAIVLALVLMVALSPGLGNVIAAIVLVDWTRFCRVIRSEVVVLRRREYVAAARIAGANHPRVILRDILPGVMPVLISLISIEMGIAVVAESILSFVGMSVDASRPTWGMMIADGLQNVFSSPWGLILPVLCVVVTVLATTLLGDGLRRSTDPRLLSRTGAKS
jgi:peptide/nickel transport system permease protein